MEPAQNRVPDLLDASRIGLAFLMLTWNKFYEVFFNLMTRGRHVTHDPSSDVMYERFTDRGLAAIELAERAAHELRHEYVGTEHLLLGLIEEGANIAWQVLQRLGIESSRVRAEAEKIVGVPQDSVSVRRLPRTPTFVRVLQNAMNEARQLNHNYVATEHLLLSLASETEGVATQVLLNLGLKHEDIRREVLAMLGPGG